MKIISENITDGNYDLKDNKPINEMSKDDMIIVFQCVECGTKYFFPATRCKKANCKSTHFKRILVSIIEKDKIYSGF